jgi:hypothetical protein
MRPWTWTEIEYRGGEPLQPRYRNSMMRPTDGTPSPFTMNNR